MTSLRVLSLLWIVASVLAEEEIDENEKLRIFCSNGRNLNTLICASFCKVFPSACTFEDEEDFVECPPFSCEGIPGTEYRNDPGDCRHYYVCRLGVPIRMPCPNNLEWNADTSKCDWPEFANCAETCGPPKPVEVKGPCDLFCTSERNGAFIKHPAHCQYFYQCHAGMVFNGSPNKLYKCDDGTYFDPTINVCNWVADTNCEANPKCTQPTDSDVGTWKLISNHLRNRTCAERVSCKGEAEGVLFPDPHNCTQFYICNEEEPITKSCPKGLVFNPTKLQCDWSYKHHCEDCKEKGKTTRRREDILAFVEDHLVGNANGNIPFFSL